MARKQGFVPNTEFTGHKLAVILPVMASNSCANGTVFKVVLSDFMFQSVKGILKMAKDRRQTSKKMPSSFSMSTVFVVYEHEKQTIPKEVRAQLFAVKELYSNRLGFEFIKVDQMVSEPLVSTDIFFDNLFPNQ